jgi:hypothetical protein
MEEAIDSMDSNACAGISDSKKRSECVQSTTNANLYTKAVSSLNETLCLEISNSEISSMCVEAVRSGTEAKNIK